MRRIKNLFKMFSVIVFFFVVFAIPSPAQSACDASIPATARANGLISATGSVSPIFNTTSNTCVKDPTASLNVTTILSFNRLKAIYYDQITSASGTVTSVKKEAALTGPLTNGIDLSVKDKLYYVGGGDLTINSIGGGKSGVVFVEKNLIINSDLLYNFPDAGIVFIVGGNVYISPDVNQVDAVIISGGNIYTAGTTASFGCTNSSVLKKSDLVTDIGQLVINGSLMNLNTGTIFLCRDLGARSTLPAPGIPSEKLNYQAKYLVILRDLLPYNRPVWQEVP